MAILNPRSRTNGLFTRALVIDSRTGWDVEAIESSFIDSKWKRYLYHDQWLPVIIRNYSAEGEPIYTAPVLPKGMSTPPEKLYRALTVWPSAVKRFVSTFGDIWSTLKKGALIGFLVAIGVALMLVWGSMTGG